MGRYLGTMCADLLDGRTLRLYCKLRYLLGLLRSFPRPAKTPLPLDLHRCPVPSSPRASSFARRAVIKNSRLRHMRSTGSTSSALYLRDGTGALNYPQAVRFFCSTSNRDAFKAEAPIGVLESASQLSTLGVSLGESFNRVSRHINMYFKRQGAPVAPLAGMNASVVITTTPEYLGRSQRRGQSQRPSRERRTPENKEATQTLKCEEKEDTLEESQPETHTPPRAYAGLQLFHVSSLATRFGESYSYVANHINSAFSRSGGVQIQQTSEELSTDGGSTGRHRRRTIQRHCTQTSIEVEKAQAKMSSTSNSVESPTVESDNVTNNWDEGYLHFARHVNRYFGAKGADEADHQAEAEQYVVPKRFSAQPTSNNTQSAPSQLKQEGPHHSNPKAPGLFHYSSVTTGFGESYFHMANHINRYFKGQGASEEELDTNYQREMDPGSVATHTPKPVSLIDCLWHPTTAIPNLIGGYLKVGPWSQSNQAKPATSPLEATYNRRVIMSMRKAEEMTHRLLWSFGQARTPDALTACVEALNEHLIHYPSCKAVMWQEKTAVQLLKRRRWYRDSAELQGVIRETLALIGYVDPVKGRGIRVLSIDGGGTRGVVPLQVLKLLEAETGKPIHQLFDYICGVSTGAILAFMLGLARFSLEDCAEMYRRFGSDVFRQNPLVGTVNMGWSHSYYNTENWEAILREKMGEKVLIKTARDQLSPKVSAVSAVVNWGNTPKAFVFRNYNHSPGCLSRYAGGSGYQMWQAVRASSAAPGYFQEYRLQSDIHQDGGILLNNPCALAVHESRLLWPRQPFQCVLSLGTGRFDSAKRGPVTATSLRAKISNLICSATDTEGVHTLLDDLLPPDVYFRFNPMLSAEVSLDESGSGAMEQLQRDTQRYLERNRPKLARLRLVLGAERSAASLSKDWVSERAWEMKQRWV